MGKKDTDKKLGRFSTILEIITNLGQIFTWVLGVGSAYVLNIQTKPIVVPGIDITLDLGFQFALLISAMLGYIHFLQKFWEKNTEKLKLSDNFEDFALWDIPRLKQPLLLIPIVIAFAIFIQVSIKSAWLVVLFVCIVIAIGIFSYRRFSYHLSPERQIERLLERWSEDETWFEDWCKRIKSKLDYYGNVTVSDLYEVGNRPTRRGQVEIEFALGQYFRKFEFQENLVLMKTTQLPSAHPEFAYDFQERNQWILLRRENLKVQRVS
jgi:hypothetical protein